ncbi:hypothetical protein D3C78_1081720 [compost metagenome]
MGLATDTGHQEAVTYPRRHRQCGNLTIKDIEIGAGVVGIDRGEPVLISPNQRETGAVSGTFKIELKIQIAQLPAFVHAVYDSGDDFIHPFLLAGIGVYGDLGQRAAFGMADDAVNIEEWQYPGVQTHGFRFAFLASFAHVDVEQIGWQGSFAQAEAGKLDTVDIDILPHVHVVDADPEGFRQIITTGACFIPPNRQQAMLRLGFCLGRIVMLGCG